MLAPGAVASHQHRQVAGGQLHQREVDQLDQVRGGAGRGVAGPQQARQGFAGSLAAVQVGQQRVEAEGVLVGARRALLRVAVGVHQGRVGVHDQQLHVRVAAGGPGAATGMGPGGAQPGQPVSVPGDAVDHAPGGRGGGDRAEQLRLVAQHRQVGQAIATVGQHDRQIAQHGRVRMPPTATLWAAPAKRPGQPNPVGQLPQQRRAGMPDHTDPVGGDFEAARRVGSLHPQGALLEPGRDLQTAAFSLLERAPCLSAGSHHPHLMKSQG